MTKEQTIVFVNELANEFMNLYQTYISKNEYDPILVNGYCLYFATILQKLMNKGEVVYCKEYNHYLFCYEKEYYDGSGIIEKYNNILNSYYFGFIRINTLINIENVQEELDYTSCCDFDYEKKQLVWRKIEPLLYTFGRKKMDEIQKTHPSKLILEPKI